MSLIGKLICTVIKLFTAFLLSGLIAGLTYTLLNPLGGRFARGTSIIIFLFSTILLTLLFHRKFLQFIKLLKASALVIGGYILIAAVFEGFCFWPLIVLIFTILLLRQVGALTTLINTIKWKIDDLFLRFKGD